MSDKINEVVEAYIKIRAIRAENKKVYDEADKELKAMQESLEGHALKILDDAGLESCKTASGTLYTTVTNRFNVKDRDALDAFAKEHGRLDIFGNTLNKETVAEIIAANGGELPPGVGQYTVKNARFRNK